MLLLLNKLDYKTNYCRQINAVLQSQNKFDTEYIYDIFVKNFTMLILFITGYYFT